MSAERTAASAATYAALALSDADVFAALCALPALFRFEVNRTMERGPDSFLTNAVATPAVAGLSPEAQKALYERHEREIAASIEDRVWWTVSISSNPYGSGPMFLGRDTTLAGAWHQAKAQIAAFTEVLA